MQPIIAVVFDFDDTLAPDSTTGLMNQLNFDAQAFWAGEFEQMLRDGWDQVPGFLHKLVQLSDSAGGLITKDYLANWGERLPLFEGVEDVFDLLRGFVQTEAPDLSLEFYLISSGIGEVLRHTKIAHHFTAIWASDFVYDPATQNIRAAKRVVSFTDKTRYLFQISKGIIGEKEKDYNLVNKKFETFRIPMSQMLFLGDGTTDIPCFSLLKRKEGKVIAVYSGEKRESWKKARHFIKEERVQLIERADYRANSLLLDSIKGLLSEIIEKINL